MHMFVVWKNLRAQFSLFVQHNWKLFHAVAIGSFVVVSFLSGVAWHEWNPNTSVFRKPKKIIIETREYQEQYPFVNALIDCVALSESSPQTGHLEQSVKKFLETQQLNGIEASVYFRNLSTNDWFGINENQKYIAASLNKLHLLVITLKLAELNLLTLQQTIRYEGNFIEERNAVNADQNLATNQDYTIDTLLKKMIINSDNEAYLLLLSEIETLKKNDQEQTVQKIFDSVYQTTAPDKTQNNTVEVARVFRILYNANYLSIPNSNYALTLLKHSDFESGLRSPIPNEIDVASKFGQTSVIAEESSLHECGIIYAATTPYILCIMTRGPKESPLYSVLQEVSRIVYSEVISK